MLIVINLIVVTLLGTSIFTKMKGVRECSNHLFMAGILFEIYFIFFLVRLLAIIGICFCIKKPLSFYWASQTIFAALDSVLFTTLVIWAAVVIFRPEVVECRKNDVNGSSNYWFFVAFCCVIGLLYSLFLIGICCLALCCLCVVVAIIFQNQRQLHMRDAINRVPMA